LLALSEGRAFVNNIFLSKKQYHPVERNRFI
jgi:hypothetical protein